MVRTTEILSKLKIESEKYQSEYQSISDEIKHPVQYQQQIIELILSKDWEKINKFCSENKISYLTYLGLLNNKLIVFRKFENSFRENVSLLIKLNKKITDSKDWDNIKEELKSEAKAYLEKEGFHEGYFETINDEGNAEIIELSDDKYIELIDSVVNNFSNKLDALKDLKLKTYKKEWEDIFANTHSQTHNLFLSALVNIHVFRYMSAVADYNLTNDASNINFEDEKSRLELMISDYLKSFKAFVTMESLDAKTFDVLNNKYISLVLYVEQYSGKYLHLFYQNYIDIKSIDSANLFIGYSKLSQEVFFVLTMHLYFESIYKSNNIKEVEKWQKSAKSLKITNNINDMFAPISTFNDINSFTISNNDKTYSLTGTVKSIEIIHKFSKGKSKAISILEIQDFNNNIAKCVLPGIKINSAGIVNGCLINLNGHYKYSHKDLDNQPAIQIDIRSLISEKKTSWIAWVEYELRTIIQIMPHNLNLTYSWNKGINGPLLPIVFRKFVVPYFNN